MPMDLGALLLLADGRFPAGGHAHSGGIEPAVADGRVTGPDSLESYLRGRLGTVGLTDATLAAAVVHHLGVPRGNPADVVHMLDAEAEARIVVPHLRGASRRQGRQLCRVAERCWPSALFAVAGGAGPSASGVHLSVALGLVSTVTGLDGLATASVSLHHALSTPAHAAVRLLGMDPFAVAACLASLSREVERTAADATDLASGDPCELPARSGPIVELAALDHRRWDVRMFAT